MAVTFFHTYLLFTHQFRTSIRTTTHTHQRTSLKKYTPIFIRYTTFVDIILIDEYGPEGDTKNIFLWLGFSHFFAMLYFFSFFFAYETDVIWKRMPPPCGMESSLCTCSQNSARCTCMPRGTLIEVRFTPPGPSDWRGKKTTKENIKKKIKELASS